LTFATTNPTTINGSFSVVGDEIQYLPAHYFLDSGRYDPTGLSYFDSIYARCSDGTNASPYVQIRVVSLKGDGDDPSDGIPDYWMQYYFGHTDPQAGDQSQAIDDADGDGLDNLQEFIAGTNPTNAASGQRITSFDGQTLQWQAKACELYELLGTTNLSTWTRVGNPMLPTDAPLEIRTGQPDATITASVSNLTINSTRRFYRIQKVP
jgi:hypothetical protein